MTVSPWLWVCRNPRVSRTGYYEWLDQSSSARATQDGALIEMICRIHRDSQGTYGEGRIVDQLAIQHSVDCGRKRVARLLREAGLRGGVTRAQELLLPSRSSATTTS